MAKGTRHVHQIQQTFVNYLSKQIQVYLVDMGKYKN